MKPLRFAGLFALGFAASGCATIIEGTTMPISVASYPEQGAACTLTSSEGTYYVTTPGTVTVHKTKNDLHVHCTKAGFQDVDTVAPAHFAATTAANVLAGGIVGLGVDAASGANYYYESPVVIQMNPVAQPAAIRGPGT